MSRVILDRFRLDDRVAVVTGAGRGLGAAMALAFAEAGADVLIAARTQSQLEEVAEQVRGAGRRAHIVVADLARPEDTSSLAAQAVEAIGKLDIVLNNVGGTMPGALLDTTAKDPPHRWGRTHHSSLMRLHHACHSSITALARADSRSR